jgi:CBS domain-containing protein
MWMPHSFFYIVKTDSGLVDFLWWKKLDDKCDEGDILGLRPFFENYLMDAMAREEKFAIPMLF